MFKRISNNEWYQYVTIATNDKGKIKNILRIVNGPSVKIHVPNNEESIQIVTNRYKSYDNIKNIIHINKIGPKS